VKPHSAATIARIRAAVSTAWGDPAVRLEALRQRRETAAAKPRCVYCRAPRSRYVRLVPDELPATWTCDDERACERRAAGLSLR
jgi:hypothetical protein